MGNKRLAINLFANTISYSTTVLVAFFLTPYLVNTIGKEGYSFYPLANNFVNYMSIFTVALNSMASRYMTIEIVRGNKEKVNTYFASAFYANCILSLILIVPMIIIIIFLEKILNIPLNLILSIKLLFTLVFISMLINIVSSVFSIATFARNRIDLRSSIEVVQGILRIVMYLSMFALLKPSIVFVGYIAVILNVVYFLMNRYFTKKLLPDLKIKKEFFSYNAVKELLSAGIWNSVNQLGVVLIFNISLLMGNVFFGSAVAGDFSIVQIVPNFINGIISMLTAVFLPTITKKYAENDFKGFINEVHKSQRIMGLITNIPIGIFIGIGTEFFSLWVPGQDAERLQMLSIFTIVHLIIVGVVWPVANLNIVMNKIKLPSLLMIINGFINILLSILFINFTDLGLYSIPISSMVVNIIWFGVFIPTYPCKNLSISKFTFYLPILKTVSGTILIVLFTNYIKIFVPANSWLNLILVCVLSAIVGLLINMVIVVKLDSLKSVIKR